MELKPIKGNNFVWINIDSLTHEAVNSLTDIYPFHHLDLEDCLSKTQLPKIDEYKDYLFIILHFPRFLKEKRFSIPSQVSIFLGRGFLVTVHNGELKPINNLFQKCKNETGAYPEYMGGSSAFLLYKAIHAIVENLMLMLGKVIFNLEELEEKVFDDAEQVIHGHSGGRIPH